MSYKRDMHTFFFFNNKNRNKAGAYPGTVVSSEAVEIGRGVEGVL